MRKLQLMLRLINSGIIAVVRAESYDQAVRIAEAVKAGGIEAIEITTTVPGVLAIIQRLADSWRNEIIIGAGSVLDGETARSAILAGSEFLISPHLNLEMIKVCNRYQKISLAGAMSVREVVEAMEAGSDFVKLFPGNVLGPEAVKAIRGPLPFAPLVPTGGVSLNNVAGWVKTGCELVCVGGELTRGAATGDYQLVTSTAKKFVQAIAEARAQKEEE